MSEGLLGLDWPQRLALIAPPEGLACVGFGGEAGTASLLAAQVSRAVLIEAQPDMVRRALGLLADRPAWQVREAVLSDMNAEGVFYLASNPVESSLLAPESLTGLWKNIRSRKQVSCECRTLASELEAIGLAPGSINWLVVDCVPALPILRGAEDWLASIEVLAVRAVLGEGMTAGSGATRSEIDAFLIPAGYKCVGVRPEAHPAIGLVVYARDWRAIARQRESESHEQRRQADEWRKSSMELQALADDRLRNMQSLQRSEDGARRALQEAAAGKEMQQRSVDGLQSALAQAEAALRDAVERDNSRQGSMDELRAAHQQSEAALREATEREKLLQQRREAADSQQASALEAANAQVAVLANELEEQRRQTLVWSEEHRQLQQRLADELQKVVANNEAVLREAAERENLLQLRHDALLADAEAARDAANARFALLNDELQEQRRQTMEWHARVEQLDAVHNALQAELAQVREANAQQVEAVETNLREEIRHRQYWHDTASEFGQLLSERRARIDALTKELEKAANHAAWWEKEFDKQVNVLKVELESFRARNHELERMAHLTTKLIALRESDLRELRERYEAAVSTQQRQHTLLVELEDKLRLASQYFHQLQAPAAPALRKSASGALAFESQNSGPRRKSAKSRSQS
jgi:hypothetical protein